MLARVFAVAWCLCDKLATVVGRNTLTVPATIDVQSILQLTLVKIMPEDTHADAQTDKLVAIYRSHIAPGAKYTIGMN